MKYNDSITQANRKMSLSVALLQQWRLPADPINFAICYAYISKTNKTLIKAINQQLKLNKPLDEFFLENIYRQYVLGQSNFRDGIITDLDDILGSVQDNCQHSANSVHQFIEKLDHNVDAIQSHDQQQVQRAVTQLQQASTTFKQQQLQLIKQLSVSNKQSSSLRKELDDVRKEIFLDPLTGLYNRKAMENHVEAWFSEDPNKQIAAIVISVNDFEQFNFRFGNLISNVILAKVAQKVSSYVDKSGFPVRSGGDEFLILLPDIKTTVASEIAEKIRHGVAKLRFRSTKTGISLPQISISLGISEMNIQENVEQFIHRARATLALPC